MAVEVKVPPFPESVQQGVLAAWRKRAGEAVARNEKIADIETDKIVLDVTAPEAGVLAQILVKEGSEVKAGALIATIEAGAISSTPAPSPAAPAPKPVATPPPKPAPAPQSVAQPAALPVAPPPTPVAAVAPQPTLRSPTPTAEDDAPSSSAPDFDLSPAVRHLVKKHNLNPAEIAGHGRGGRITKADVLRHLEHSPHLSRQFGADTLEPGEVIAPPPDAPPPPPPPDTKPVTRIRMTPLRAKIAKRLVEAQQTAAMLTTFNEVNMSAILALRQRYKESFEKEHGVKLGFMAFFVKAVVEALARYPVVNASVEGDEIVYHGYFDIGVAVSTPRGLVVPVIRDAEQLSIDGIEKAIADAAARAQAGKLGIEEISGGTFTISNGGVFGSLMSTPILNPPQSAILGMHRIQERPVAENGQVVIRPMMYLALSYDHRIIDGREAVSFLVAVKDMIEDPTRLLLHV